MKEGDTSSFPDSFLWACATASYQVEGAAAEDGRGPSVWDTFAHTEGRVRNNDHGDVACDQYHRYAEDVQLMKWLGVKAYRFSVSWSRVFPEGDGETNEAGIAYYERLVDELVANGIQPWLTFFHWDLPQALEDRFGGWRSRETSTRFADYVAFVTRRLSDRVAHYFTINELVCFTDLGYDNGMFAPGLQLSRRERNQVRHHGVLARPWSGSAGDPRQRRWRTTCGHRRKRGCLCAGDRDGTTHRGGAHRHARQGGTVSDGGAGGAVSRVLPGAGRV